MKLIPLTKGYFAKVDDEDFERLSKYSWSANSAKKTPTIFYANRTDRSNGGKKTVAMHREIFGETNGLDIDHIDGDRLNNQKCNLRVATRSQNNMNCKIKKHSTKYKGVSVEVKKGVHTSRIRYRARILSGGLPISLGYFKTPEEAAVAYDCAATLLFGEFARTNQQMGVL